MQIISERAKTDKKVKLELHLNTLLPETEVECVVVIHPIDESHSYDLTEEEYQMLEERWSDYFRNPKSAKSCDAVKARIRKNHGL